MKPDHKPAVLVEQLVKSYSAEKPPAVDGISFAVAPGTIFGLLGPNGAGKTTTIKMILGLVLPTSGAIELAGYPIPKQSRRAMPHVGAVLEGARNIYWRLSARANLEYFGALRGLYGKPQRRRIAEVLELVELSDRADEEVRYLSRGMQQKVALAAAILHDPQVLLLDEPTLGLDVQAARTIEGVIQNLAGQGKTILLTTHQMALAERMCGQIFVIHYGRQIIAGPTRQVIAEFGATQEVIEIRLESELDAALIAEIQTQYPGLELARINGKVILSSIHPISQKEFLTLLEMLDKQGLSILQAGRRAATLEEVFLQLTATKGGKS